MDPRYAPDGEHGIVIELLAAGTRGPAWIEEGVAEYTKRLPKDWRLSVKEIPVAKRTKGAVLERLKQEEGQRMLNSIRPGARVIAMDSGGALWSTETLADKFDGWSQDYRDVQLMIGGPDGLSAECLKRADDVWSLSKLTFPHFMVRLLLAEQVYRAWAILNGHPYHK